MGEYMIKQEYRIISKTKNEVEFEILPTKVKQIVPIKDFYNIMYKGKDGFYRLKRQYEKQVNKMSEEVNELVGKAVAMSMLVNSTKDLKSVMAFGSLCREFCEKFNQPPIEFIKRVQIARQQFMGDIIEEGGYFHEDIHPIPNDLQDKNKENKPESKGVTIGDQLKAQGIKIKI